MENLITYIGSGLSVVAAAIAWFFNWYFNHESKRYDFAQNGINNIIKKRFDCYPEIWKICQEYLSKEKGENGISKQDTDELFSKLRRHYEEYGIYYSSSLQKEMENIFEYKPKGDTTKWYEEAVLLQCINGSKIFNGILPIIKDDLGAYTKFAASVIDKSA